MTVNWLEPNAQLGPFTEVVLVVVVVVVLIVVIVVVVAQSGLFTVSTRKVNPCHCQKSAVHQHLQLYLEYLP